MSTGFFLLFRVAHILLAATWVGATVFSTLVMMPAIGAAGRAGGDVMVTLNRKGMGAFFGAAGGLTVLTGIVLLWRFTSGFEPELSGSREGIIYSVGGLAGLLSVIVGGSGVGRSTHKLAEIMQKAAALPDGQEKGALLEQVQPLQQRMGRFALVVVLLQVTALTAMSLAHFV